VSSPGGSGASWHFDIYQVNLNSAISAEHLLQFSRDLKTSLFQSSYSSP